MWEGIKREEGCVGPGLIPGCCCSCCRIPPNIRDIVYCTGVSLMDEDVWEFIWMKFHSSAAVSEKKVLLEALTCSDNVYLLNRCERQCESPRVSLSLCDFYRNMLFMVLFW